MTIRRRTKEAMKAVLERAGVIVLKRRPSRDPELQLVVKMRERGIGMLLDVGANTGQFATRVRRTGYCGPMISFEPLSAPHEALVRAASRDPCWTVAPRMALGDEDGTDEINIAENSVSSSLLDVEASSIAAAPASRFSGSETIDVRRLDAVADPAWRRPLALKLDTQGFEMKILDGALQTLPGVSLILAEMSLAPLYRGGAGFSELFARLETEGFRCVGLHQGFANDRTNELLQVDGLFARERGSEA